MLMISRMSQFRSFPAVLTGVALLSLACSGSVDGNGDKGGAAASGAGGTSGSGGTGKGGTGGTGNTSGSGGAPASGVAAITRVARLTHNQYQNTIVELFGITDRPTDAFAPDASNGFSFDTSVDYRVDGRLGGQYRTAAEELAARVVAEPNIFSRVVPCTTTDAACQGQFIASFGERAFRRPLFAAETTRFTALFAQGPTLVASGDAFRDGVRLVVEAMLQSPQFLYRTELSSTVGADGLVALDDWEIASRLSYLAWDSMPDAALFTAARQGMLHTPEQVSAAAARILAEPRALTKMVSFHEQAWRFSEYSRISPDRVAYPNAPANLVDLIYPATTRFVEDVVQGGGGLTELLTAPYAYADSALAPLYGKSVSGGLARIELDPTVRKGLLMQVGHLASHAYAVKTDPIHRGLFVLRDVLCRTIPDPPAGASMTPLPPTTEPIETTREEISLLTGQDACIGCHTEINAPGFAFEGFDATGQIRTMEGGVAVDTTGELELDTGPLTFRNAVELVDGLAASGEAQGCYVAKWLEFSYGRQFAPSDQAVRAELAAQPLGARTIATRITATPAFLLRAPNEVGP
ncbi:MAG TPA: DUF1592 domain-containing protein [Polyangiaceae bacterium]|nr:DUF1592 domain-containing protein [Polyangiaceae bacterium]